MHGTGNGNVVEAAAGGLGVKVTGLTLQLGRWVSTSRFPDFALNFAASASAVGGSVRHPVQCARFVWATGAH